GPLHLAAQRPDRVEPRVVDPQQVAVLVTIRQAQRLVELQSLSPRLETLSQASRLSLAPAFLVEAAQVDQRKRQKAPRVRLVEGGKRFLEPLVPATVEIDDRADPRFIHLAQIP